MKKLLILMGDDEGWFACITTNEIVNDCTEEKYNVRRSLHTSLSYYKYTIAIKHCVDLLTRIHIHAL